MGGITYLFRLFEVIFASILIIVPIAYILLGLTLKKLNCRNAIKCIFVILVGFFILYLLFFAGEYTRQNVKIDTVNRLLNLSVENINMELFSVPDSDELYVSEDLVGEYHLELKSSTVRGTVRISRYHESSISYEPYYSFCRLLAKEYTNNNAYVVIEPRESDRDFFEFPLIRNYMSSISVLNNGYLIEIIYWELKNDPQTVDMIIDSVIK